MVRKSVTEWARKMANSVKPSSPFSRAGRGGKTDITAPAGEHRLITTKDWYAYGRADHSGFPYQSSFFGINRKERQHENQSIEDNDHMLTYGIIFLSDSRISSN